ncbi:capsular polysaccharide export protein, LipB/KpsS family [Pseudogulbenkiania subflava]|uniref:Capsule polysaccharide biosynthesis protein n=1 Tax=Pseudogulbenkiania subflava DSM 22618 TaxID=1123014 RepID=A0A1Y6BM26_9NEIS|nr:hypothetical protein [Pseudogulbenkiania subflava]SMF10684.1 Capsule polysaccharide biosynthesis protein [Pseudogulbenkiania subflava DSM 22618]
MNILLLSNGAPNYHYFFNSLAQCFHEDGAKIVVAVDSKLSRDTNGLDALGFEIYEFPAYFAVHQTNPALLAKYADRNLNAALLSDFERAEVYGIWGTKDHDYFERLKSALLSYFEEIFQRHGIDTVLYENVSNTLAHFALFVAEKHGARYCGVGGSRLPGRFSITDDPLNDDEPAEMFKAIRSGEREVAPDVRAWSEDYLSNIETIVPDYMKINGLDNTSLIRKYVKADKFKRVLTVLRHAGDDSYHAFQIGNPLRTYLNLFWRSVKRKFKLKLIRNRYEQAVEGESFLLYPMHFHPESSTSILAGTYLDEYEVIRNIAFNLPQGMKLYVKDHISAWGYPSLAFYNKVRKLPNVRLLHPNAPTKLLIKQSRAVITLTSTVGYEAVLLGKKVFMFGKVFYDFHKDVVPVANPAALFALLKRELAREVVYDKQYNVDFVCAYYSASRSGALNLMLKDEAAHNVVKGLYPTIRKYIA